MSYIYGAARNGHFTSARYSAEHLTVPGTIQRLLDAGLEIYAMFDTSRDPRPVTDLERMTNVKSIEDLQIGLYQYDLDVANGVAKLNANGEIEVEDVDGTILFYKGSWDAQLNQPLLLDGKGVEGHQYFVSNAGTEFEVDFGSGTVVVNDGQHLTYLDGKWKADYNNAIPKKYRDILDNAMQQIADYKLVPNTKEITIAKGGRGYLQLAATGVTRPEYFVQNANGLSGVNLHVSSGALVIDTANDDVGSYYLDIRVGGPLGRSLPNEILVHVEEAG